jgi:type II secretion system protein I
LNRLTRASGFTLIEVAVALTILSLVLTGALTVVSQYSDERLRLRERAFATQVSWNRLLERYQIAEKWVSATQRRTLASKGIDEQYGQQWRWQMSTEAAMGQGLFRYEVEAGAAVRQKPTAALAIYLMDRD